jgi:hypothetical protein
MRSLSGSLLQIPRYALLALYMFAMTLLFFGSVIAYFPAWAFGQLKNQFLP